jgi:hypothetical protein
MAKQTMTAIKMTMAMMIVSGVHSNMRTSFSFVADREPLGRGRSVMRIQLAFRENIPAAY